MLRNCTFALTLLVALAVSQSASAQGQGQGQGPGQDQGHSTSNGSDNRNGNGGSNSNRSGKGNAAPGEPSNARRQPEAPNAATKGGATIDEELTERDALDAVEAGRAVSLSAILPDVRARTGGEIINVQLQQSGSFLLYALTVLAPDGKVTTQYYYARTGRHVEE
jgi:hypothetical protein